MNFIYDCVVGREVQSGPTILEYNSVISIIIGSTSLKFSKLLYKNMKNFTCMRIQMSNFTCIIEIMK